MKILITTAAIATAASLATAADVYTQGFETDTAGWTAGGVYGSITRVASGTDGITSSSGNYHATVSANPSGAYTNFGGYSSTWSGPYTTSIDVYLDTNWANNTGFDYTVASSSASGSHLRDFIFHVSKDASTGNLIVGASNNTDFLAKQNLENGNHTIVSTSGWYTLQHTFRDAGDGTLAVDLELINEAGIAIFTETRNNTGDLLGTVAGGNRYGWFTFADIGGPLHIDNARLTIVPLPPAAWAGLAMLGGIVGVRKLRRR